MNLHEYQGKQLFAEYGLPVSKGFAAETPKQAVRILNLAVLYFMNFSVKTMILRLICINYRQIVLGD